MKRIFGVLLPLVFMLGACTSQEYIAPRDLERASELNAQLGLGYMNEGQFQRAKGKLDKALKFNPDNANAYHYMAELYRRLREFDKAEENYKKAMSLAPSDMNIQNNYGVYLCERGLYDRAYQHFKKIIANPLYAARANAYENIGLCAMREGKLQRAEKSFKAALAINSKMPKSLLQMAQLSFDKGRIREAYRFYSRYIAISPQSPESLWIGILLERERGNKDTVASYKILLKGKYPDSEEAKRLRRLERMGKL